jgi:hypothetical protein
MQQFFSPGPAARKTVVESATEAKRKFHSEAFEKNGERVERFRPIEILDHRNNTKASPESAEDKRDWTGAGAISTRRPKFKATLISRRRAAPRVVPFNQPLVGARICDNIQATASCVPQAKARHDALPVPCVSAVLETVT